MISFKHGLKLIALLAMAAAAISVKATISQAAPLAQTNLLQNPGLEAPFNKCGSGDTADGWACWYSEIAKPVDASALQYAVKPRFAEQNLGPGQPPELVHGANASQHVGYQLDPWIGGIEQTVNVAAGSQVQFCAYARLYANNASYGKEPSISSLNGRAKVGIDPHGNGSRAGADTQWSAATNPHDTWQQLCVQATVGAEGKVTVFTSNDYRGSAASHLDAWWDDTSLTVLGPAPTATGAAPIAQPTSQPVVAPPSVTSTPNPDGSIVHVVQSGDTLFALSLAYNVPVDQIYSLNNLNSSSLLSIGQRIIIRAASGPTSTPTLEPGAATSTPEPTATVEAPPTAQLCVQSFDDTNADGLLTPGEQPLGGAQFAVANQQGVQVASYTTDGSAQPHCFDGLQPGSYTVAVQPAAGTIATSDKRWGVSLAAGSTININFGSRADANAPSGSTNANDNSGSTNSGSNLSGLLGGAIGLIVLLIAGVLGAFVIARRRG
jgi:LysM repeat protein